MGYYVDDLFVVFVYFCGNKNNVLFLELVEIDFKDDL